jgi:hypothetical protein
MSNKYYKKPQPKDPSYTSAIEKRFPHIAEKLSLMWGTPDFSEFLNKLMIDDRGNRQGFPPEVIDEMLFLHLVHDMRRGIRLEVSREGYRFTR